MAARQEELSHEYLLERVNYDPDTGIFTWRPKLGRSCHEKRWNGRMAGKVAGGYEKKGYIAMAIGGVKFFAHRLAWFYTHGEWPPETVDHIDCDPANNRMSNLRLATISQNAHNSPVRSRNKIGIKGVRFQCGKYEARIMCRRVETHLGYFDDINSAAEAYRQAALELHGEFARFE